MMMDADRILKKQIAGGSCKIPDFTLVHPTSVMNVSNSIAIHHKGLEGVSMMEKKCS